MFKNYTKGEYYFYEIKANLDLYYQVFMIMKLLKYNSSRLRNAEQISLANDVLDIIRPYDWAASNVLSLQTWIQESNTELQKQLNKEGTVNETQVVRLADVAFNDSASLKIRCKSLSIEYC